MKPYSTGEVAKILGIKNPRKVAKLIDSGSLKGRLIHGRDGRARRSYRVVSRASLLKYVEANCLDIESALSWFLAESIRDFEGLLSQAEDQCGFLGANPGLARGIRAIASALRPDTSERSDPLSKIAFEKLSELMKHDIRLRLLRAANLKNRQIA